tara:strand:- start:516 stop:1403 length:888 start_codon:yes stop_codon:yes gene_type:complete
MLEEARIYWKQHDTRQSIRLSKKLLSILEADVRISQGGGKFSGSSLDAGQIEELYVEALRCRGKWMAETKMESIQGIIDNILKKAVDFATRNDLNSCKLQFTMAKYADKCFTSIKERTNSKEWQSALSLKQYHQDQIDKMSTVIQTPGLSKDVRGQLASKMALLKKQNKLADDDREKCLLEMRSLLTAAVKSYIACLSIGDKYDTRCVFRLCSLWFSNSSDIELNRAIIAEMNATKIPLYKFLPLIYQITSRISEIDTNQDFQKALQSFIAKLAGERGMSQMFSLFFFSRLFLSV